ncbi:MAG TPA: hypothetical protein VGS27_18770 [Candidatus Sulfotelmatobacter sp.]|nr:hypothetical protein [Candidatus Sulfotelmatobacter sp.]
MIPSARYRRLLLCFTVSVALLACTPRQDAPMPATVREIAALKDRLVPRDGLLVQSTEPVRSTSSVKASWEIQTKSDPATYFRWLEGELSPAYHTTSQTDSTLLLGKEIEGDSYIVTVTSHQGVGGALVEVQLVAMPD